MIRGLSHEEFVKILHTHLSPTSPIQSQEHLFGRSKQLQRIEQALYAPGRSVFIYGDRGVGKTSLAHTVAFSHQASRHDPVLLACLPTTTFSGLLAKALCALRPDLSKRSSTTHSAKVGYRGMGLEVGRTVQAEPELQTTYDVNGVIAKLLSIAAARNNENTVVVVDEFDRMSSDEERAQFADFIKQVARKHHARLRAPAG